MFRELNILLIVASLIGGTVGFVIGELLLDGLGGHLHSVWLMGLYFGVFALTVNFACLIAETISPDLNGSSWRVRYSTESWKLWIPVSLGMLFVAGALLQFIYGLSFSGIKPPKDYFLVIDRSESMLQTDPDRLSMKSAEYLIDRMASDVRVSIVLFNNQAELLLPVTALADEAARTDVKNKLAHAANPSNGTDIGKALEMARTQMAGSGAAQGQSAIILLSDGYSDVDTATMLAPFVDSHTAIHTIGMLGGGDEGTQLLKNISSQTGGRYYSVKRAEKLEGTMSQIYSGQDDRILVGERMGMAGQSAGYAFIRILALTIIGLLLGLTLGIIFNNKHLARRFIFGGVIAGIVAGLILEFGLKGALWSAGYRAVADLVLALIVTFSMVGKTVTRPTPVEPSYREDEFRREGKEQFASQDKNRSKGHRQFR
jgi:Ca-activated chloride channel family protein